MDRRSFLAGAALAAVAGRAGAGAAPQVDDLRTAAREGWLYGLPLLETARVRAAYGDAAINAFVHARAPTTASDRRITQPETAVLTSMAWIDLTGGVATLRLPDAGTGYFTLTLLDMYSNVLQVLGSGGDEKGRQFVLIGPEHRVGMAGYTTPVPRLPPMHKALHFRDPWIWAVARVAIPSEGGLDAAHDLQDRIELLHPKGGPPPAPTGARDAAWGDYFYAVQGLIEESPPPPYEVDFFRRIAPLQLGMVDDFERARFADPETPDIEAGVKDARILVSYGKARENTAGGWLYPKEGLGQFGQDFLYRAQTALRGLGALPSDQVFSVRAVGDDGVLAFPSDGHYRLTLPGPPPTDGPWSLTLYEVTPEGQLFLTDNAAGKYALGSAGSGLRWRSNGEADVWIGRQDPGGARTPNWLPAPADAPFALVLSAYRPHADLVERRYVLPPLQLIPDAAAPPPPRPQPHRR